jgi:predicted HTH domain antitoxin
LNCLTVFVDLNLSLHHLIGKWKGFPSEYLIMKTLSETKKTGHLVMYLVFLYICNMKNLVLHVPDHIDLNENETRRFLAAKMFEIGRFSLGQAADLAGMSKLAFSEILSDFNVSLINYNSSDVIKDAAQF